MTPAAAVMGARRARIWSTRLVMAEMLTLAVTSTPTADVMSLTSARRVFRRATTASSSPERSTLTSTETLTEARTSETRSRSSWSWAVTSSRVPSTSETVPVRSSWTVASRLETVVWTVESRLETTGRTPPVVSRMVATRPLTRPVTVPVTAVRSVWRLATGAVAFG